MRSSPPTDTTTTNSYGSTLTYSFSRGASRRHIEPESGALKLSDRTPAKDEIQLSEVVFSGREKHHPAVEVVGAGDGEEDARLCADDSHLHMGRAATKPATPLILRLARGEKSGGGIGDESYDVEEEEVGESECDGLLSRAS